MTNKIDMMELFEKHVDNLNLSRRDDFIVESIKLSYFSGFADAMNNLTENWFNTKAEECREILEASVRTLQELQQGSNDDELVIDLSDPEPVTMDYSNIKIDND
jgi:hypothetical protein